MLGEKKNFWSDAGCSFLLPHNACEKYYQFSLWVSAKRMKEERESQWNGAAFLDQKGKIVIVSKMFGKAHFIHLMHVVCALLWQIN